MFGYRSTPRPSYTYTLHGHLYLDGAAEIHAERAFQILAMTFSFARSLGYNLPRGFFGAFQDPTTADGIALVTATVISNEGYEYLLQATSGGHTSQHQPKSHGTEPFRS